MNATYLPSRHDEFVLSVPIIFVEYASRGFSHIHYFVDRQFSNNRTLNLTWSAAQFSLLLRRLMCCILRLFLQHIDTDQRENQHVGRRRSKRPVYSTTHSERRLGVCHWKSRMPYPQNFKETRAHATTPNDRFRANGSLPNGIRPSLAKTTPRRGSDRLQSLLRRGSRLVAQRRSSPEVKSRRRAKARGRLSCRGSTTSDFRAGPRSSSRRHKHGRLYAPGSGALVQSSGTPSD